MPVQVKVQSIATKREFGEDAERFRKEIAKYYRSAGKRKVIEELDKTTQGWNDKPRFVGAVTFQYSRSRINLTVRPKGKGTTNWIRVNSGTGPRMITSKKKPMTFNRYYRPKTTPQGRYGGSGTKYGPKVWRRRTVGPHTIEPRDFVGKVTDKVTPGFERDVENIKKKVF